ncbi:NXF1 factor, partial [Amia calva]|nr:NXF1 factor [Amia calva]
MGKRKDLSDFDKGQIVMARRLGQSISKTAALVGCSRSAVVSTYQKWSKEGKAVNRRQGHGWPKLIDARGERRLVRYVQSNRRATVAQTAEKVDNRVVFYVDDASTANALCKVSGKITATEGHKVYIVMQRSPPPPRVLNRLKPQDLEQLKQCMSKRFDASQHALDLNSIRTDTDLVSRNIEVILNRTCGMQDINDIIEEKIPELLSLNLSNNRLYKLNEVSELVRKAPNLKILNLSHNEVRVPPLQGSTSVGRNVKRVIQRFLQEYYKVYDSGDRRPLLEAYQDTATFSLQVPRECVCDSVCSLEGYKTSSNVKELKDPTSWFHLQKQTRQGVVALLNELPKTQHDTSSFVVDVHTSTKKMVCFTVSGVFKEVNEKSGDSVRMFSRTFITVPAADSGLCIVNDELFVQNAKTEMIRWAFATSAPMPSSSSVSKLTAKQQKMLSIFSTRSRMNLEWSQKCLQDNAWDFNRASQIFTQLKVSLFYTLSL